MRALARALLAAVLAVGAAAQAASALGLKTGAYELTGYNDQTLKTPSYHGHVIIERAGEIYTLVWKIGRAQTQKGVALLSGNVLSVAYLDMSGRDSGVVSYRLLGEGRLDGRWAPHGAKGCGREVLVWKSPSAALESGESERF